MCMFGGRVDENEVVAEVAEFGGRKLAWFMKSVMAWENSEVKPTSNKPGEGIVVRSPVVCDQRL